MATLTKLTAHDKCDTGDRAYAQTSWTGPNGGTPLLFCGHHTRTNGQALREKGFIMTGMDAATFKTVQSEAAATVSAV